MKKRNFLIVLSLFSLATLFYLKDSGMHFEHNPPQVKTEFVKDSQRSIASLTNSKKPTFSLLSLGSSKAGSETEDLKPLYELLPKIFSDRLDVQSNFVRSKALYGNQTAEAAYINAYISLGDIYENPNQLGSTLSSLVTLLNKNPSETLNLMRKNVSMLKSDPFVELHSINILINLEVDRHEKLDILEQILKQKFSFNPEENESKNMTIALIAAKEFGTTTEEIYPIYTDLIEKAASNREKIEIQKRFENYFPQLMTK